MGRQKKIATKSELQRKVESYFKAAKKDNRPLTISGLAISLDVTRETLNQYSNNSLFSDTIKKAKLRIENYAGVRGLAHILRAQNFCQSNKLLGEDSLAECHWHSSPPTRSARSKPQISSA